MTYFDFNQLVLEVSRKVTELLYLKNKNIQDKNYFRQHVPNSLRRVIGPVWHGLALIKLT